MRTLSLLLCCAGCAAGVRYVPQSSSVAPARFVRLEVVEARPPGQGGDDPRSVGTVRGGYGNPMAFRQPDPGDVTRLVRAATEDALGRAGVGVRADATTQITARVMRFWMDGYVAYGAEIEVEYTLGGWSTRVSGKHEGAVLSFGAASDLLSQALAETARAAVQQFSAASFQQLLN